MLYAGIVAAQLHVQMCAVANTFMFKIHKQFQEHGGVLEQYTFTLVDQLLEMEQHPHWD